MKKIKNLIGAFVLGALFFSSCDMERLPKSTIPGEVENSFETMAHAKNWDNGVYSSFRARQYGDFVKIADVQADQLNAAKDFGNNSGFPHGWIKLTSSDYDISGIWEAYYSAIKNANLILTNLPKLAATFDATSDEGKENIATLQLFEANARFVRAYYYAELAKRYGTIYNQATAASDLCVPLVLVYNINEEPGRATNEAVYKQISEDIAFARKVYMEQKIENKPKNTRFSPAACDALEARVSLEKKDYTTALELSKKLIDSKVFPLVNSAEALFNMWRHDDSTEDILQLFVSKPDEIPSSVNNYFSPLNSNRYPFVTAHWFPTQWMLDLYSEKDYRKKVYFEMDNRHRVYVSGVGVFGGLITIIKYWSNPTLADLTNNRFFGVVPTGRQAPKVFRIAESYLIAMESAYMSGKEDIAKTLLNELKSARGLDPINLSGNELFEEIKNERTRELAFEGHRLWDLRRWNMPMIRRAPQNIAALSRGAGSKPYYELEIPAGHNKFVWGIPANDMLINKNLKGQQNPGW